MFYEQFLELLPYPHLSIYQTIEVCLLPWLLVLLILSCFKKITINPRVLSIFVAFSSGSILAESILHALPMIFPGHFKDDHADHHHHHHEAHSHEHHSHDHGNHGHFHGSFPDGYLIIAGIIGFYAFQRIIVATISAFQHNPTETQPTEIPNTNNKLSLIQQQKCTHSVGHTSNDSTITTQSTSVPQISHSIAIISILGDLVHNFSDGLQISLSFATSRQLGFRVALSIAVHEFLRTLSDVSILLQHGKFSLFSAIFVQLLTFSATLAGSLFGDLSSHIFQEQFTHHLPPISFGLSLYLAISLLQSMDSGSDDTHGHGHSHGGHSHSTSAPTQPGFQSETVFGRLISNYSALILDLSFLALGVYSTELTSLFE